MQTISWIYKWFWIKKGAIGGSVAHDSHNILLLVSTINLYWTQYSLIQANKGGLVAINEDINYLLKLPIGGLMSEKNCDEVAYEYKKLNEIVTEMGSSLKTPFMTLAFMALLVIPELKIGDKGLFECERVFIN